MSPTLAEGAIDNLSWPSLVDKFLLSLSSFLMPAKLSKHILQSHRNHMFLLSTTQPHPIDKQVAEKELRIVVQIIEGACAQLSATVARPSHTIANAR